MKLVSGVGFSNGCAELALKEPPPLVPSSLMISCEANGPLGDRLRGALDRHRVGGAVQVLDDALRDEEQRADDRDRQQDVEEAAREVDPEVAELAGRSGA